VVGSKRTVHEVYRFESEDDDERIEATVLKALPRRVNWEARIDGTPVVATGETRREVVDRAIAAARRKTDRGLPIGMGSARALRNSGLVELKGIEPLASTVRLSRSTN
jgi:predicted Fe-S protein YdhL (DUF1289 family)